MPTHNPPEKIPSTRWLGRIFEVGPLPGVDTHPGHLTSENPEIAALRGADSGMMPMRRFGIPSEAISDRSGSAWPFPASTCLQVFPCASERVVPR